MSELKNGFTMIEVIFVIVVLGILASVALPKLVANKNDASAAKIALELGDCIEMACGEYTKTGTFDINSSACTDVTARNQCFVLSADNATGILNVRHVSGVVDGSVCKKAQLLIESPKLSSLVGIDHLF
jgi:prepilin-type N-terminal cleavage/methylation domain-containing protein